MYMGMVLYLLFAQDGVGPEPLQAPPRPQLKAENGNLTDGILCIRKAGEAYAKCFTKDSRTPSAAAGSS